MNDPNYTIFINWNASVSLLISAHKLAGLQGPTEFSFGKIFRYRRKVETISGIGFHKDIGDVLVSTVWNRKRKILLQIHSTYIANSSISSNSKSFSKKIYFHSFFFPILFHIIVKYLLSCLHL